MLKVIEKQLAFAMKVNVATTQRFSNDIECKGIRLYYFLSTYKILESIFYWEGSYLLFCLGPMKYEETTLADGRCTNNLTINILCLVCNTCLSRALLQQSMACMSSW